MKITILLLVAVLFKSYSYAQIINTMTTDSQPTANAVKPVSANQNLRSQNNKARLQNVKKRQPASLRQTEALFIGHNLTPSTEVAGKYKVTLGNYAAGFGITENLFVATSPWILYSYNTMNIHLKYSQVISPKSTAGLFVSYFDSYNSESLMGSAPYGSGPGYTPFATDGLPSGSSITPGTNRYQWTSYSVHGLYSYRYDGGNTQYFNLKYSYFVNDEMPYSLRMDPGDDSIRDQIDISTLVKMPVEDEVSVALEGGLLGANYKSPFAHIGASFVFQKPQWLIQVGASYTAPLAELGQSSAFEVGRMDQRVHYSQIAGQYYTERYLQVAVHPEIQLQFNF